MSGQIKGPQIKGPQIKGRWIMSRRVLVSGASLVALLALGAAAMAQSDNPAAPTFNEPFRSVPVSHLLPNGGGELPDIQNPMAKDPASAQRGMKFFSDMNCIGCHAPNGGGGEGPALSNIPWIYGDSPANIYLTIVQGRPNGMPAFGTLLPDDVVWDLVSYIEGIKEKPGRTYGYTTSRSPQSPKIEQVPAEFLETTNPWSATEPFPNGQMPPDNSTK
jgi:cytochrome c oxidase cbb3-type subunit 3